MATLVSISQLAVWTREDIEPDDPFALMVLDEATALVVDYCGRPDWEDAPGTAPRLARRICLIVAGRTYLNPDMEVATGTGPISSRVRDEAAAGMQLTESEMEQLDTIPAPPGDTGYKGLFTITTTRGADPAEQPVLLYDNSGSPWPIEYANEGDTTAFDEV